MNNIYSSRKIETSCKRDINFMYLLGGASAPDHSTIARFRSIHFAPVCESLMAQFTNFLGDKNEISKENPIYIKFIFFRISQGFLFTFSI